MRKTKCGATHPDSPDLACDREPHVRDHHRGWRDLDGDPDKPVPVHWGADAGRLYGNETKETT